MRQVSHAPKSTAGSARTGTSSRSRSSIAVASSGPSSGASASSTPPGWLTVVADEQGEVVGFVSVGPSRDERGIGELYAIYVHPDWWGTGAGRALIERGETDLRSHYAEAVLWVLEDNPRARSFYEAAGWSPDGAVKSDERWGVRAPEVRYRKSFA